MQGGGGGELVCCDGLHCMLALCIAHLLEATQAEVQDESGDEPWLRFTCRERGRSPSNPDHLKPSGCASDMG